MATSEGLYHDVTVIGAGWSGLLCTKYMLEEGLSVATIEKRDNLGGVWYFTEDENVNTVMRSTYATSSRSATEMSDFAMPDDKGEFLHHKDMLQYLHAYASHFRLLPHIHFTQTVTSVEKIDDFWHVSVEEDDELVYVSKYLIVATGSVDTRNEDDRHTIFKDFHGTVYHAGELKDFKQCHDGCKLLIYGGGETAADICFEWHNRTKVIYWSAPRGQHFFRKYTRILPWRKPQVLDKVSSQLLRTIAPYHRSKPGLQWICKWTSNGSLLAYQGHGLPEWKNDSPFMHFVVNKNGSVLDLVDYKKVYPKASIKECSGHSVTFSDGETADFDVIILSTGYKPNFSFLQKEQSNHQSRYRYVFDNNDPSLAYVGFVRPVVGSIPVIAEIQARWVAKVFAGEIRLPSANQRFIQTKQDIAFWNNYFKNSSRDMGRIVEGFVYLEPIIRDIGIRPNFFKLLLEKPYYWYVSIVSPFNSSLFRLNETNSQQSIVARLNKHRQQTMTPFHLFLILFLRFIWFDWVLKVLEGVKYRFQTSITAKNLEKCGPVRTVNSIWCLPKRYLFEKGKL